CFRGKAWCDVSWSDDRGWVSSRYLEYLYRNRYVYLPDYVDEIDVPVVPFALASYWSSYYAGRPWYQRRAHRSGYWQSNERFATRHAGAVGERAAVQPGMTRENARMTRENARAAVREQPMGRARTQTPPIMARGHDEPRAAAPRFERAAPHMTQPNAARGGGGPAMRTRAQQRPAAVPPRH